jgi:histidine phosphotransfer protein HptB
MSAPVDLSSLHEITGGDTAIEKELFASFLESSDACLAGLRAAGEPAQETEWRKHAHAFKGISLNLGAAELGHLCKEAQDKCQAPPEQRKHMLAAIEAEFARVRAYLDQAASAA